MRGNPYRNRKANEIDDFYLVFHPQINTSKITLLVHKS